MSIFDVVIFGAGAAGMMAAIEAGKRGRSVLLVDHAESPGEKIRISGGGRCNFTNVNATTQTGRDRFLSQNPRFALSALARYTPDRFAALVKKYGISFHEKTLGQLFCDGSSQQVINLLTAEMSQAGVKLALNTGVDALEQIPDGYKVTLTSGIVTATSVIVATGGKSIPKMGATAKGYHLAAQFGLKVTDTRPALVPLTFEPGILERLKPLAGVSADVVATANGKSFPEAMLFTHRGLSGPAILQISSYWREGDAISIDLLPGLDLAAKLREARKTTPKLEVQTILSHVLPKRLAQMKGDEMGLTGMMGDFSDKKIAAVVEAIQHWTTKPTGSEGYPTAEVTLGGVDTDDLDSTTMQARKVPGLFFIGEVVDVTGWLGGYNFQWAWASGWAAGQVA